MSRLIDVAGMHGFGVLECQSGEPPIHAKLDDFRAAVEAIAPARYLAIPYDERWVTAIEAPVAHPPANVAPATLPA